MNIFGKKKKIRTQEQIRRRFYTATGLVAVMLAVCLLPRGGRNGNTAETVASVMDAQLDSLLRSAYGEGFSLKGAPAAASLIEEEPEERRLLSDLRFEYDLAVENMDERFRSSVERVASLREQIDELAGKMPDIPLAVKYYVRRINVTLPDGTTATGFQKTAEDLSGSVLARMQVVRDDFDGTATENSLKNNSIR